MLVHVFDTLTSADDEGIFLRFLEEVTGWEGCSAWRQGRNYLVEELLEEPSKKKKEPKEPERVSWPGGMLYQKLEGARLKTSLPVLWKLCKYYDTDNETSDLVREYLRTKGVDMERVPFYRMPGEAQLQARCKPVGKYPKKDRKVIQITVDKSDLTVTLLPHRGVVQVLLRRLEEVAL